MIGINEKDMKLLLLLAILLIIFLSFGCFYWGIQYAKTSFIEKASSELDDLLISNFSYVCGNGWDQFYLTNITIDLIEIT